MAPTSWTCVPTNSLFGGSRLVAPVYNSNPAVKLPERTSSVSNLKNLQHKHAVSLPSIQTTPTTTTTIVSPAVPLPREASGSSPVHAIQPVQSDLVVHNPLGHDVDGNELSEDGYEDLVQFEDIWHHVLQSDQEAEIPPPCACHNLPKGSCPTFKKNFVDQIQLCRSFNLPNMDGARAPLLAGSSRGLF